MSKDLRPVELYTMDKYFNNEIRNANFYFVKDGVETPLESDEERAFRSKFKELGFLFSPLYSLYLEFSYCRDVLESVLFSLEERLEHYIETGIEAENDTVWLWFHGKLDPQFYYNDINNENFVVYIKDEIKKLKDKE